MDTFCHSPITTNTHVESANVIFASERENTSDMLVESLKGLTLDSTINNSAYYNSDKYYAESNPLVATLVTERKEKSLILTLPTESLHINY